MDGSNASYVAPFKRPSDSSSHVNIISNGDLTVTVHRRCVSPILKEESDIAWLGPLLGPRLRIVRSGAKASEEKNALASTTDGDGCDLSHLLALGLICWWNISAYGNSSSSTSSWILRLLRRSDCWLDETAVGSSACFVQCLAAKKARLCLLKPPPRAPEETYRRLIAALIG